MIDFPKPIVAALRQPAQGLGAKLASLCDLVCDEVSSLLCAANESAKIHSQKH